MKSLFSLVLILLLCSCNPYNKNHDLESVKIDTIQATSLLGKELIRRQVNPETDSLQINNYLNALLTYNSNPMNPDFIIWLGRRMAYLGDYKAAIGIFNEGILKFPEDARMYRHRGHRYISTRQLDNAITDFEKAVELIQGTEDIVEPDGIPNRLNKPVSSLHTNIYYHLGLAYYLKNDLDNALLNFDTCLKASKNDDMIVASKHWLYMIMRRMNQVDKATQLLDDITTDMDVIENDGYHDLLLFYKGELTEGGLKGNGSSGSSEAVQYGIANWHHYNSAQDKAIMLFQTIVNKGNWAGFGYIAAEADLSRMN